MLSFFPARAMGKGIALLTRALQAPPTVVEGDVENTQTPQRQLGEEGKAIQNRTVGTPKVVADVGFIASV